MYRKNIFICSLALFTLLFAIGCDRMETQVIDKTDDAGDDMGNIGNVVTLSDSRRVGN